MAHGSDGRGLMGPFLVANCVVLLIVIGLAGWCLDKYIDGEQDHPHLGGNAATMYVLIFALLAGTIGVVSVLTGLEHLHSWQTESMAAADSSAAISFSVMALAFGVVWKEIAIGGQRGKRLQTLEVFVILSTFTQILYLTLLHAGMCYSRYGPSYGKNDGGTATRSGAAPEVEMGGSSTSGS